MADEKLRGPVVEDTPRQVRLTESWHPLYTIYDGVRDLDAGAPFGVVVDLSAAAIDAVLTVYKPDGTTNYTRTVSVSGEGAKVGAGTTGQIRFDVPNSDLSGWTVGRYAFDVLITDTDTTPDTARVAVEGTLDVLEAAGTGSN